MSERGSIDLSDFMNRIKAIYPGIERDEIYPKAMRKGAKYLAGLIEERTQARAMDLVAPATQYKTARHKKWHPPGQARENVIVYQRKGKSLYQSEVNANLSLLVGYEKSKAYYMYWREYGNKNQSAQPIVRPVYDAHVDEALEISLDMIAMDLNKRLAG